MTSKNVLTLHCPLFAKASVIDPEPSRIDADVITPVNNSCLLWSQSGAIRKIAITTMPAIPNRTKNMPIPLGFIVFHLLLSMFQSVKVSDLPGAGHR